MDGLWMDVDVDGHQGSQKEGPSSPVQALCERAQLPCLALGVSCVLCVSSVSQFFFLLGGFLFFGACLYARSA